jgi:hypothetical protein
MPKIQSYVIKTSTLSARDKWIGTDSSGSVTKNFTPEGMATFINETDFVTIAGQAVFKWQQSAGDREDGSISLVGFGGDGDNLSGLTNMLISDKTIGDSRIVDYLTAIVGQNVIMVEVNVPNNFVIATLTGVTPNTTYSGFNDLTWDVTLANGVINGSGNYVLANFSGSNVDGVVTSLAISSNILTYTDEAGNDTDIDLALYLDDTNLARLTSGSIDGSTGLATFTRDDATTFTVDMSAFLDAITLNNTLTSTSTTEGLTAAQGKVLKDLIDGLNTSYVDLTTAQSVGGIKTFTDDRYIDSADNTISIDGDDRLVIYGDSSLKFDSGDGVSMELVDTVAITGTSEIALGNGTIDMSSVTGEKHFAFPDTSGTVALTSTLGITATLSTTLTYSELIGNGTLTSIVVTHDIGNQFVQAQVYEVAGMDKVECEIELTSSTTTTFKFNVAPASNALRVVIIG